MTEGDYKIALKSWAKCGWCFFHAVSFTVPQNPTLEQQNRYREFFESLPNILPCKKCQGHLKENYATLPIDVSSPRACSEWLVKIHNTVNTIAGKAQRQVPYLEVVAEYLPPEMYHTIHPSASEHDRLLEMHTIRERAAKHVSSTDSRKRTIVIATSLIFAILVVCIVALVVLLVRPRK